MPRARDGVAATSPSGWGSLGLSAADGNGHQVGHPSPPPPMFRGFWGAECRQVCHIGDQKLSPGFKSRTRDMDEPLHSHPQRRKPQKKLRLLRGITALAPPSVPVLLHLMVSPSVHSPVPPAVPELCGQSPAGHIPPSVTITGVKTEPGAPRSV